MYILLVKENVGGIHKILIYLAIQNGAKNESLQLLRVKFCYQGYGMRSLSDGVVY